MDRLAIWNAWRRGRRVHAVLALQLLERDVEVHVAKAGDDELVRLLVALDVEGRVLLTQPGKPARDLLLVAPRLRRDRQAVGRPGQVEGRDRPAVLRPQRVAGERVGELGRGGYVPRGDLGRGDVLLASWEEDLGQALLAATAQVRQVGVGLDRAGKHLEVAHAPELVAAGAEDERLDRLVRLGRRRRHQLGDRGHQRPYAEQLRGRSAQHRRDPALEDALAQTALDLFLVERPGVEVFLE